MPWVRQTELGHFLRAADNKEILASCKLLRLPAYISYKCLQKYYNLMAVTQDGMGDIWGRKGANPPILGAQSLVSEPASGVASSSPSTSTTTGK
jgi:hypothetical protein